MSIPAPKLEGECRFGRCVSLYADGELDASRAMEVETHLLSCTACAERLELTRATRTSLKRCAFARASAPPAFRARLVQTLQQSCAAAETGHASSQDVKSSLDGHFIGASATDGPSTVMGSSPIDPLAPRLVRLRYAMAMAAAAGIAFAMGAWRLQDGRQEARRAGDLDGSMNLAAGGPPPANDDATAIATSGVALGSAKFDRMLEELVALHANPLPPETTNPDELNRFDPLVGVPVRRPAFSSVAGQPNEVSFNGARVHAMRDRRAAVLQYSIRGGHRITMYVFNPEAMSVKGTGLEPRVVREHPVYVGHFRGYSVAATEQRGVGYALATDLDDDKCAQMVASVAH